MWMGDLMSEHMVKREVTTGNLQSIATTVLSWATILVAITLAYGRLTAKDDLMEADIARVKLDLAREQALGVATADKLNTIQGDIRVIKNILESQQRNDIRRTP